MLWKKLSLCCAIYLTPMNRDECQHDWCFCMESANGLTADFQCSICGLEKVVYREGYLKSDKERGRDPETAPYEFGMDAGIS